LLVNKSALVTIPDPSPATAPPYLAVLKGVGRRIKLGGITSNGATITQSCCVVYEMVKLGFKRGIL
jgi:hypothetical protein